MWEKVTFGHNSIPDWTETNDWRKSWSQLVSTEWIARVHACHYLHVVEADKLQIWVIETIVRQNLRQHQKSVYDCQTKQHVKRSANMLLTPLTHTHNYFNDCFWHQPGQLVVGSGCNRLPMRPLWQHFLQARYPSWCPTRRYLLKNTDTQ